MGDILVYICQGHKNIYQNSDMKIVIDKKILKGQIIIMKK